ncbi:hypothetical protein OG711_07565 [Streptomyces uncialis]|uniref:hypothetical protein n=1 Tax=Streptomyces uncialis TaxID=1048205 RepID=UPI002253F236|nr:hypothetical protein [Streptomyces uncialis]MCX4659082.1 hypothetical protein [Streptomyces uncialis]
MAADDVAILHAELDGKGLQSNGPLMEAPWGSFFSINDPDGNHLLIVKEPKDS